MLRLLICTGAISTFVQNICTERLYWTLAIKGLLDIAVGDA